VCVSAISVAANGYQYMHATSICEEIRGRSFV